LRLVDYTDSFYAVLLGDNLHIFDCEHNLIDIIENVLNFSWICEDKLYFINIENQLIRYIAKTREFFKVNFLKNKSTVFCYSGCMYLLSIKEEKESFVSSLPFLKNNITINVSSLDESIIMKRFYSGVTKYKVDYLDKKSGKIFISLTEYVDEKPLNRLILLDFNNKVIIERELPIYVHGICSYRNILTGYAKTHVHGSYTNQHVWMYFFGTQTLTQFSNEDKYYGNCTLSDVEANETINTYIDENRILYVVSQEGETFIEQHDFSTKNKHIIYQGSSSIIYFNIIFENLFVLESTLEKEFNMKIIDLTTGNCIFEKCFGDINFKVNITKDKINDIEVFILRGDKPVHNNTILWLHGGPMYQFGYGHTTLISKLINYRYNILAINGYGRQGYGQNHSNSIRGKWGTFDLESTISVLQELKKQGKIDFPIKAIGHSYGAYLLYLLLSKTGSQYIDRAIGASGISSMFTMFGTSDIGCFEHLESNSLPWKDMQYYLSSSPLYKTEDVNIPLLLMHAKNDIRVPVGESLNLFSWLRSQQKDVSMFLIETDNHKWIYDRFILEQNDVFETIRHWLRRC
jgi:alpha-beta hydrolase superfamily lysophospholipase